MIITKKFVLYLLMIITSVSITKGLFAQDIPSKPFDEIVIVVSISPLEYFVSGIFPEASVVSMVTLGANAEKYNPTAKQMETLAKADIFFTIGLPYEKKVVSAVKDRSDTLKIVELGTSIERMEASHEHEHEEEDEEDEMHEKGNPHIWMSFENATIISQDILSFFQEIYPQNRILYQTNYDNLLQEIQSARNDVSDLLGGLQNRAFLIYHPVLSYYAKEFNLTEIAIQKADGVEPSLREMKEIYDVANENNVTLILVQKGFSDKTAKSLGNKLGANIEEISPLEEDWKSNMYFIADVLINSM